MTSVLPSSALTQMDTGGQAEVLEKSYGGQVCMSFVAMAVFLREDSWGLREPSASHMGWVRNTHCSPRKVSVLPSKVTCSSRLHMPTLILNPCLQDTYSLCPTPAWAVPTFLQEESVCPLGLDPDVRSAPWAATCLWTAKLASMAGTCNITTADPVALVQAPALLAAGPSWLTGDSESLGSWWLWSPTHLQVWAPGSVQGCFWIWPQ